MQSYVLIPSPPLAPSVYHHSKLTRGAAVKALKLVTYPEDLIEWKETLEYILKYPRRVYTNLFPSRQTYWLVFMLFVLNGTDWVAFEVLNLGNSTLEQTPLGSRIIDGLFQAIGTTQLFRVTVTMANTLISCSFRGILCGINSNAIYWTTGALCYHDVRQCPYLLFSLPLVYREL